MDLNLGGGLLGTGGVTNAPPTPQLTITIGNAMPDGTYRTLIETGGNALVLDLPYVGGVATIPYAYKPVGSVVYGHVENDNDLAKKFARIKVVVTEQ